MRFADHDEWDKIQHGRSIKDRLQRKWKRNVKENETGTEKHQSS